MYDFLKKVPLFADLPEDDLERLCEGVEVVHLPAGAELFSEGSVGDKAYVIQEGQIEILKHSGGRVVLLAVRQPGEVIGEISLLEAAPRNASGRARTDSILLAISHDQLDNLLKISPSAARAMLHTITSRLRTTELVLQQSEKMAQLGTLTAGIAHELNNPAAAAQRGAGQLLNTIEQLQKLQTQLGRFDLATRQMDALLSLDRLARERALQPVDIASIDRSDLEAEFETWLDEQGVENAWELAPTLVNLGFDSRQQQELEDTFSSTQLPAVIEWLGVTYTVYSLLAEIVQGAGRIAEIVKSLKTYVYLDQAPVGVIDVHEGLDNTLVMMRSKIRGGITVKREYAPDLPRIQAYGSELNQVWTNLIDNAIDAMDGKGEIVIRTRSQDSWVVVEIQDNGRGIPQEIQSKIFSPFFTTKPVGKGTGLGLNTSYNIVQKHAGEIKVYSRPGRTCFEVRLPVNFEAVKSGAQPMMPVSSNSDEELRQILESARTVAVVGITDRRERPAYSVPAYLKAHGYRIIPVNPNKSEVLGEKAYPDLSSVPEPIDVVQIFRRSEAVPPIVTEAIQVGAKVIWMQEGIINEEASAVAGAEGLQVVMDKCMRAVHKRLFPDTQA